jgi:hypothetical protein
MFFEKNLFLFLSKKNYYKIKNLQVFDRRFELWTLTFKTHLDTLE